MQHAQKIYLAASGMITAVGANTAQTVAAVRADISAFEASEYLTPEGQPITFATVPHQIFDEFETELDIGSEHGELMDRQIKMAIIAASEAVAQAGSEKTMPLILALPQDIPYVGHCPARKMLNNLVNQAELDIDSKQSRSIQSGRAGGIEALDLAHRYLYGLDCDYVLVGGSDSYRDYALLNFLNETSRTTAPGVADGFVPGEAAAFLVLTRHVHMALQHDGAIFALHLPGIATEPGHIYSDTPCLGDGLNQAFQKALASYQGPPITNIHASMNGENFWAKEYGAACLRNSKHLDTDLTLEHPADCYGDIGTATGPVLIALAVESLKRKPLPTASLVYSSSDRTARAAVVVEKLLMGS